MGRRRKSGKRVQARRRPRLPTQFKCPQCGAEASCDVKMDLTDEQGTIECRICGEKHSCTISALSDPVDVYADWIDELQIEGDGEEAPAADAGADDAGGLY